MLLTKVTQKQKLIIKTKFLKDDLLTFSSESEKLNFLRKELKMYQIKVNGILMPTIYWSLGEAMKACELEKERGVAVMTEIVHLY